MEEANLSTKLLKKREPSRVTHRIKNVSSEQSVYKRHDNGKPLDVQSENARSSSSSDFGISECGRLSCSSLFSDPSVQHFVAIGFSNSPLNNNFPRRQLREEEICLRASV